MMKEYNIFHENNQLVKLLNNINELTSEKKYQFTKYHIENLKNLLS